MWKYCYMVQTRACLGAEVPICRARGRCPWRFVTNSPTLHGPERNGTDGFRTLLLRRATRMFHHIAPHRTELLILINTCSIISLSPEMFAREERHQWGGWGRQQVLVSRCRCQPSACRMCECGPGCINPAAHHLLLRRSATAAGRNRRPPHLHLHLRHCHHPPSLSTSPWLFNASKKQVLIMKQAALPYEWVWFSISSKKLRLVFYIIMVWEFWNEAVEDVECWQKGQPQNGQFLYLCVQGSKS